MSSPRPGGQRPADEYLDWMDWVEDIGVGRIVKITDETEEADNDGKTDQRN